MIEDLTINEAMVSPLAATQHLVLEHPIIPAFSCLFELSYCPVVILTNFA